MKEESAYPVQFSVEYPESSNRLTAFFRIILAIPILVVGNVYQRGLRHWRLDSWMRPLSPCWQEDRCLLHHF